MTESCIAQQRTSATVRPLMKLASLLLALCTPVMAELRVPAFIAFVDPDPNGLSISKEHGISNWKDTTQQVLWFGELKAAGKLTASIAVKATDGT